MSTAVVAGATGILGREIVLQLAKNPQQWSNIYALSRSKRGDFPSSVKQSSIDLTGSVSDMASSLRDMSPEYIFFSAYLEKPSEQEAWQVNGDMLQSFLDALKQVGGCSSLKRVILVTGCKQYGVHLGPTKNPMLESDRWLTQDPFPPNFYYRQQDILRTFCEETMRGKVGWTVTYPNDVIGFAKGNFMNLASAIGIYAVVEKELGHDLIFPGSERFYTGFDCHTDAGLHAQFCEWAALEPKTAGQAFNVVNGETDSYQDLWPKIAARFGIKVKADQFSGDAYGSESLSVQLLDTPPTSVYAKEAGLEGKPTPGRLEQRVDLVKWSQRGDVKKAWQSVAERNGLEKEALEQATWGFLGFVLGRAYDMIISMGKARELGWTGYKDTFAAFAERFDQLEAAKVLPSSSS